MATLNSNRFIFGLIISLFSCVAHSQQSIVAGKISAVEIVAESLNAPGNYDLRVYLKNNPVQCNGQIWSYVNITDQNYKSVYAAVLVAKTSNYDVTLSVSVDATGFCRIGYLVFN